MCRYTTFARIFLIVSIINFARAAPVILGVHEASSDSSWPTPPTPESSASWPSPDSSGVSVLPIKNNPQPEWHPPSSDSSWPSPGSSATGPSELPANNARPPSSDSSESWPSELPKKEVRPPSPELSWPYVLNSLPSIPAPPPHQSGGGHPLSSSGPSSPTVPETKDFLNQLNPSRDPPSPAVPETKDSLGQLLGPGPSHAAEPETKNFLDLLLKGRIKRRIYGPGTVQESQDPMPYVFTSPSPANLQSSTGPWRILIAPATSATSSIIGMITVSS